MNFKFNRTFKFFLCILVIFGLFRPGITPAKPLSNEELMERLSASSKPTCEKIKKKINAALELYLVESPSTAKNEVKISDLEENGYLKFKVSCPEGGKYFFNKKMEAECSKCDVKKAPPAPAVKTAEVGVSNPKTLDQRINKYLDREDSDIISKTGKAEKGAAEASKKNAATAETEISKKTEAGTGEVETASGTAEVETAAGPAPETEEKKSAEDEAEQMTPQEGATAAKGAGDFQKEAVEFARKGEVDKAIERFQKAIELVPDSFVYHYNYGLFLAKIESYDLAYIEFQRALRLNPSSKKVKDMIEKLKKVISSK